MPRSRAFRLVPQNAATLPLSPCQAPTSTPSVATAGPRDSWHVSKSINFTALPAMGNRAGRYVLSVAWTVPSVMRTRSTPGQFVWRRIRVRQTSIFSRVASSRKPNANQLDSTNLVRITKHLGSTAPSRASPRMRLRSRDGQPSSPKPEEAAAPEYWVLVSGFSLSYHSKETIFIFTIDPHYGNSFMIPSLNPRKNPAFGSPGFLLAGVFGEAGSLEVSWNMMFSGLSGT